ncbi:MAG: hypothetical protein HGA23_09820, partial [Bacteroidales bacterium]|nr:hypothetical protein [Bacteroidales bacterium]
MQGKKYIWILLFLAGKAVFGASPDSAGIFIPDKNVERLAQEYDRIYFPLFIKTLNDIGKNKNLLVGQYFQPGEMSDPSPDTINQLCAPGSPVEVVYYKKGFSDKAYVISLPVPWSAPGNKDPSWNLWFQSLTWLEGYLDSNNPDSVFAAYKVIDDWILHHTQYPDRDEKYAFADHPSALRMWVLLKAFNKNKQPGFHQAGLENLLLMSLLSHIFYIVSLEKYTSWHNHGAISDQYLIKTLKDLPGFTLQQQFLNLAFQRIFEQFRYAFTTEGIHKEHSPCYHLFVIRLMDDILEIGSEIKYPIHKDIKKLQSMDDRYS